MMRVKGHGRGCLRIPTRQKWQLHFGHHLFLFGFGFEFCITFRQLLMVGGYFSTCLNLDPNMLA